MEMAASHRWIGTVRERLQFFAGLISWVGYILSATNVLYPVYKVFFNHQEPPAHFETVVSFFFLMFVWILSLVFFILGIWKYFWPGQKPGEISYLGIAGNILNGIFVLIPIGVAITALILSWFLK